MSQDNKEYKKQVKEMIEMSKNPPLENNINDEMFEVRGTCFILLDALSSITDNLIASIPFDIIRKSDLELISAQLREVRDTHFSEFLPDEEENENG